MDRIGRPEPGAARLPAMEEVSVSSLAHRPSNRSVQFLAVVSVAVLLAGCSSAATAAPATLAPATAAAASQAVGEVFASQAPGASCNPANAKTLEYINAQAVVSRWVFDEGGFKAEAAALCDNAIVIDAGGSADTQSNEVDAAITKHVDAVVMAPVNIQTAGALYARLKAAGIATVDYNFTVPNATPDYIVDRDSVNTGVIQAQDAVKAVPAGNYIIIGGDQTYSVALAETQGNLQVLQPYITAGKIHVVSQQWNANWSPATAQAQVEAALVKTNNNIQAVLSNNDGMAIGAEAALKAQGLLGKVWIAGVDCDLPNIQAIAEGNQAVCMWNDFTSMGKYAAMAADAAARGITLSLPILHNLPNGNVTVPTIQLPNIAVDKAGLCQWLKQYQWVPFDQAYKFVSPVPTC